MFSLESPLQTDAWAKVQRKLGKPTSTLQGDGWSALCVEEKRAVGSYLYVPYGPICRDAGALDDALRAIHAHARRRRAWWVRVEPRSSEREALWSDLPLWRDVLEADRFHPALHDHQPKHTRLIDLTAGPDAILAAATGSPAVSASTTRSGCCATTGTALPRIPGWSWPPRSPTSSVPSAT